MNTISRDGESHEFSTVAEFLALPLVKQFTDDGNVPNFAQGNGQLLAVKLIEGQPVFHLIGHLAKPVVLPKSIRGGSPE